MCFEGIARLSRRVWRRFVRGSREISLVPSLHRASTDALIINKLSVFVSISEWAKRGSVQVACKCTVNNAYLDYLCFGVRVCYSRGCCCARARLWIKLPV